MLNLCKKINIVEPVSESEYKASKNNFNKSSNIMLTKASKEELTQLTHHYAKKVGMDDLNTKLLVSLKTESEKEFIKKAFTNPYDTSKQLSYSEMRALYG